MVLFHIGLFSGQPSALTWSFDQALCYPPMMRDERQIDVGERVGSGEPLPGRSNIAKALDEPLVLAQQVRMRFHVVFVRNLSATGPELDQVQRVEWQPRQLRQTSGKRRLSAAGVAEDRNSFHRWTRVQRGC